MSLKYWKIHLGKEKWKKQQTSSKTIWRHKRRNWWKGIRKDSKVFPKSQTNIQARESQWEGAVNTAGHSHFMGEEADKEWAPRSQGSSWKPIAKHVTSEAQLGLLIPRHWLHLYAEHMLSQWSMHGASSSSKIERWDFLTTVKSAWRVFTTAHE